MTNVLLVAVDPALAERITALPGHQVLALDVHKVAAMAAERTEFHPDIIFVGDGVSSDQAIEYARIIRADWPDIALVLVAAPDTGLIRRASKAGIRGVVRDTIPDSELAGLIERAGARMADVREGREPHQVIVVASPKGGVGKTTVAVNLAAVLAEAAPWEVAVIDLDLQFGDVSTFLDIQPEYTVADAFSTDGDDSMLVRTLLSVHPDGFYVLCGAEGPADAGAVTGDQVRKLISQLSTSFRHLVIDTSGGLLEETLSSLEEATDLVLVSRLDVATLRACRKELDALTELGLIPHGQHMVLNGPDRRSGLTVRDAEHILGLPIETVIPASDKVALAANHGQLAVSVKKAGVRKPFAALAAKISDVIHHTHRGENLP